MHSKLIFFLVLILFPVNSYTRENNRYQEIFVEFSKLNLTVKETLDELNRLPDISVVYNGNESFLDVRITLPRKKLTVQQTLDEIGRQAPVEIIFNNNHVIVKPRKLKESYFLKGVVKDAETDEGLVGADLFLHGTTKGTITDANGKFSMDLKPGSYQLVTKYIGYSDDKTNINLFEDQELTIFLKVRHHEIQEVNIMGTRGETEDLERGRPIEKIEARTINQLNTNDVNEALHGRINGVWATKMSGAPGDHNKIRIRGISSIFGSTDPLYVVDGMIVPIVNLKTLGISDLNTHDIQSITVLKDASSTALYGYLGGNGVVLVETKKGGGETEFNFDVKRGYQLFSKRYSLMNTEDFLTTLAYSDSLINSGFYTVIPSQGKYELYPYYRDSLGNTIGSEDFQDLLFQTGKISEIQLSGQGQFRSVDYFLSGNYYSHEGVVVNTRYDKYTFTANLSKILFDKLSLRLLYKGSWQVNRNNLDNYLGNNVIYKGINYEPGYNFTPDSFFMKPNRLFLNYGADGYGQTLNELHKYRYSPHMLFYEQMKKKTERSNALNFQGLYNINKRLFFRIHLGATLKDLEYTSYIPGNSESDGEQYLRSKENLAMIFQQYDLRYERLVNNHSISSFLRYRIYKDNAYWRVDSTNNVELEGLTPADNIYLRGSQAIFGQKGSVIRSLKALIFNFNYSYKKKYTLSFFTNLDQLREGLYVSERILFSSLALDWDLSREEFLHFPEWVDGFHLYVNGGKAGNYPLNSLSNDLMSSEVHYTSGDDIASGIYYDNLANHYLSHEEVTEYNVGTDISCLDDRIRLSGDYYMKYNSRLLIEREIPYYDAGGFFYQNIGEMENKGIELSLEVTPVDRPDFILTSKFGFASNNQVITKLYDTVPISFNSTDVFYPDFYARENEVLGSITGFRYAGVWDDAVHSAEVNGYNKYDKYQGLAYLNADTSSSKLNSDDRVVIGNSIPDFTCNWITMIQFKHFSFEMMWYAVIGVDKYNATKATTYATGTNSAVKDIIMDTLKYHRNNVFYESSFFVEDASFIRLKTLTIRYAPEKKLASKVAVEYVLSFENLLTLTRYSGYDPEASIYTNNSFTDNAMDKGSYPNPMGIFMSINLKF